MDIISGALIFLCVWLTVFFMLLPVGVSRADNPDVGWDPGAPQKPDVGKKLLWTTVLSVPLWFGAYYILVHVLGWK